MADCDITDCDGDHLLSYTCNECGNTYCSEHRLPEAHNCSALRMTNSPDTEQRFASGLQDKPGKKGGLTTRDDRTGTPPSTDSEPEIDEDQSSESESNTVSSDENTTEGASHDESRTGTEDDVSDDDSNEIELEKHGHGTPTLRGTDTPPKPDSLSGGSSTGSESTTAATGSVAEQNPILAWVWRVNLWLVGLATTAVYAVSARGRRLLRQLWWILKGIARLTGAGLTLVGLGWSTVAFIQPFEKWRIQTSYPEITPLLVLIVGVVLVTLTKER